MGRADFLLLGTHNFICDQCGFKYKSKDMRKQWDGLITCPTCWEPRQPQDFVRGVQDNQSVPIARPDSTPTFTEGAQNLPIPEENS